MDYHVNLPYPEPIVLKPNTEYAKMLLCAYAGIVSEETAIQQYMYQSFIFDNEISKIVEKIGIVEMHHLELLAKTIYNLGVEPKYYGYNEEFWNASYVAYPKTIIEMLKQNIESESIAIENYEKLIIAIEDPHIIKTLKRIILDEQLHLKIFNNLLFQYEKKGSF